MQTQLEKQHVYNLTSSCVGQAQSCLAGSCEHTIWLTLYSLFAPQDLPLYHSHPLPNKQLTSVYHFPISPGFADFRPLFVIYAIAALVISNFDSNFVKLLPFLLSIVSCRFSFCCLVSGITGQRRPSAYTLLPSVICSILQFLMLLSCQRHCKTEWAICTSTLTHTCLYHLPLY